MTHAVSPPPSRILFVRLDRIGDLVLSLPVDESFSHSATVKWWIPKGLRFVTDHAVPRRDVQELTQTISIREFLRLLRDTRRANFSAAVVFHAPWWTSLLLYLARIPVRIGVRSQWHSFLFFNRGVRQKRSRAEFSELEYNFLLAESGFSRSLSRQTLRLHSDVPVLERVGLVPQRYSVVHPGMGGSALNWPTARYAELVRDLARTEKVVITGTAADDPFILPLKAALKDSANLVWLNGKLTGGELIAVLENARTVTAPSTGVLHLAASTGAPTLGLFSPILVQQPRRWGPQGPRTKTLMPREDTGPDCMATITAADARRALDEFAARSFL